MRWEDAVEAAVQKRGVARYRWLCSDANPDAEAREAWRRKVVQIAAGPAVAGVPPRPRPLVAMADDIPADTFVTTAMLAQHSAALASHLPPSVDAVVAAARSGLAPGSIIAMHLHVPLYAVSARGVGGVVDVGHGFRMEGRTPVEPSHVALVDDTVANGREMAKLGPIVRARFPDATITKVAVYCAPHKIDAVDACYAALGPPHYLEWNWQNAGHGAACAYDLDGILCDDCKPEDDDDGPRYLKFLRTARPLYLPRRLAIPMIVTARHEKYRAETEAWLAKHRVSATRLVMRDWDINPSRPFHQQIGGWKAAVLGETEIPTFAESDPSQATVIHEATGRQVICPAMGRVLLARPRARGSDPDPIMQAVLRHGATKCWFSERDPGCGCSGFRCHLLKRTNVTAKDCMRCRWVTEWKGTATSRP